MRNPEYDAYLLILIVGFIVAVKQAAATGHWRTRGLEKYNKSGLLGGVFWSTVISKSFFRNFQAWTTPHLIYNTYKILLERSARLITPLFIIKEYKLEEKKFVGSIVEKIKQLENIIHFDC